MAEYLGKARKVSRKEREKIVSKDRVVDAKTKALYDKLEKAVGKKVESSVESNKGKDWFERVVPDLKMNELCAYCDRFVSGGYGGQLLRAIKDHTVVICTEKKCPFKGVLKLSIHSPSVQNCMQCDKKDKCDFYLEEIKPIVDKEKDK